MNADDECRYNRPVEVDGVQRDKLWEKGEPGQDELR